MEARTLAKHGSQQVYNTIPKFREGFTMNCVVNVVRRFLLAFYIFKGENYKKIKSKIVNQTHVWQCKKRFG